MVHPQSLKSDRISANRRTTEWLESERSLKTLSPSYARSRFCTAKARNETLRATRHYGRAFWKRWIGYHARSRVEAKMRCLNDFGERIAARDPDRQTAEIHIRVALINSFNALGTAEVVGVA